MSHTFNESHLSESHPKKDCFEFRFQTKIRNPMKMTNTCPLLVLFLSVALCASSQDNSGSGSGILLPDDIMCDLYSDSSNIPPDVYTKCLELQTTTFIVLPSIVNSDLLEPDSTLLASFNSFSITPGESELLSLSSSPIVTMTDTQSDDQSYFSDAVFDMMDLPTTVFGFGSDMSSNDLQLINTNSFLNSFTSTELFSSPLPTSEMIDIFDDSFVSSLESTDFDSLLMPLTTEAMFAETSIVLESTFSKLVLIPTPDITSDVYLTTSAMNGNVVDLSFSFEQSSDDFSLFPFSSILPFDSSIQTTSLAFVSTTTFSNSLEVSTISVIQNSDFQTILPSFLTIVEDESLSTLLLFSTVSPSLSPISSIVSTDVLGTEFETIQMTPTKDQSIFSVSTDLITSSTIEMIIASSSGELMETVDILNFSLSSQFSNTEDLIQKSTINNFQSESSTVLSSVEFVSIMFPPTVTSNNIPVVTSTINLETNFDTFSLNDLSTIIETDSFQTLSSQPLTSTITQSFQMISSSFSLDASSIINTEITLSTSSISESNLDTLITLTFTDFISTSSAGTNTYSETILASLTSSFESSNTIPTSVVTLSIESETLTFTPQLLPLPSSTKSNSFMIVESSLVQDSTNATQFTTPVMLTIPIANSTSTLSQNQISTVNSILLELTSSSATTLTPSVTITADQLRSFLVILVLRITFGEHASLIDTTSQVTRNLETAIVNAYVESLRTLGARRKRQTINPVAKITTVGDRNSATGDVPIDFYILAGDSPVEATLVAGVLLRNQLPQIGGYEVISINTVASTIEEASSPIPNSIIIPVSVAGGVLLLLLIICSVFPFILFKWKPGKRSDRIETVSLDVEGLGYQQTESIAIQHGTPTIEKLMKRTRINSDSKRNSTLGLLASSSSGPTDAWQNNQLGNEPSEETPAALFQRVTHFSDFQPMPSPRSFKFKFHSSAVAPSPSISNQSKTSLISNGAVKINETQQEVPEAKITVSSSPKTKVRERVKLHSRKVVSREKRQEPAEQQEAIVIPNKHVGRDSEGDGGLGDVEQSSHSDGGTEDKSPTHTRPSTRRRNARRKLNSRGHVVPQGTTDGYDTTDHKSRVPPSRQSRKNRSGRNMRARPLTQSHFSSSNLARQTEHDARREIAWMSTGNGVQLVSIQPMEQGPPPPTQIRPSWQALPQLPMTVQNQTYSREQLEQLLQIHKELERVEKGLHNPQRGYIESSDSLTKPNEHHHTQAVDSSSSYSAELASQAFKPPSGQPIPVMVDQNSFYDSQWTLHHQQQSLHQMPPPPPPQMGQLLWSPQTGPQPLQTQPLSPYQLSQLRSHGTTGTTYSQPSHHYYHHPFGAS